MDRASQVLVDGLPGSQPCTYRALSKYGKVSKATLWHRAHGRPSKEDKARSQQYLTPAEERALARYLRRSADLGYPIPIKHVRSLAFCIASRRSTANAATKPLNKNWPKSFEIRNPELKVRKVKAVDWNRHDSNIYGKVTHWFEVIGKVLEDPDVLRENVYNMDETGIMLCMLGSVKVLVGKDDLRNYRGAGVKRSMITAVECISCDGRYLHPLIIWPAHTHRSNWTTHPTPGWHYACSESGYTDSKISLEWLTRVFDPQTKERTGPNPRVLVCDGFSWNSELGVQV
jgi:DDE superfamily endonuclease